MNKSHIKNALIIGLIINLFLACSKIITGIFGNSFSLFTDGINASTDVLISILMIIVLSVAVKKPDHDHHYGHEKYEGLAYFLLSLIFIVSSLWIIYQAVDAIISQDYILETPNYITVLISVIGIILKLFLFYFYRQVGMKTNSPMIQADAKNHLIDVFATSIVLVGILLSTYSSPIYDQIGSVVIGLFILRLGIQILLESTAFLTDQAPDKEEVEKINQVIMGIKDVLSIDDLKVRRHMTQRYVDVEIGVLHTLSLKEAHLIAERVHAKVELDFPDVLHCMVHVNPKAK